MANNDQIYHNGWFRDQFRCSKASFDRICDMIIQHWEKIHHPICWNAAFFARDRVAVRLYYLMHAGSLGDAAKVFGMSKSSASRYIWQVMSILIKFLAPRLY